MAFIAHVVLMQHMSFQHVGYGLKAAMRMRRETRDVIIGIKTAKFIQHQEWIESHMLTLAQTAQQLDACTVRGVDAVDNLIDAPGAHNFLSIDSDIG